MYILLVTIQALYDYFNVESILKANDRPISWNK